MQEKEVFIPKTVLLELEWVLRSVYEFSSATILRSLHGIVGLPNVKVEDPFVVAQALNWLEKGFDFADAMHLASRGQATQFASFDNKLRKKAEHYNPGLVINP